MFKGWTENDKANGCGLCLNADGTKRLEGIFKNDNLHDGFKYEHLSDGTVMEYIWKDGKQDEIERLRRRKRAAVDREEVRDPDHEDDCGQCGERPVEPAELHRQRKARNRKGEQDRQAEDETGWQQE